MSASTFDQDQLWAVGSQSLLERTLIAEYLIGKGYLTSDLNELSPRVVKSLLSEACRFALFRLAEIEMNVEFHHKFRLPISLN